MAQTGLEDGLGHEEVITWSGASLETQNVFVTGSLTAAAAVSGLNGFFAGSVQVDKVIDDVMVSGLDGFFTGSVEVDKVIGDVQVTGLNFNAAGSILVGGRRLLSVGTGSPSAWSKLIQAGSSALGAGSDVWIKFGTAFAAAPASVIVTTVDGGTAANNDLMTGSFTAGSVYVRGTTASEAFYYIAIG